MASGRVAANQMKSAAYRWRWKEYKAYLDRLSRIAAEADVPPIEFADRQSILLTNPGLDGRLQVTNTIRCAISIYNPGDIAPAHVHSPNASRTILSDKGGYTNVEGERCEATRGDIILTPNGTWHDHGNEDAEPVIWIDMLDWPLMEFLDCAWVDQEFKPGTGTNQKSQATLQTNGYSEALYGNGGLVPTFVSHQRGWGHEPAPYIHYRGDEIRAALERLRKEAGDPHEGIQMQLVNPVTGKPVFPTLNYQAQLLRPGEETLPKRETCGTFIVVIEGKGKTEIGGQTFDWEHERHHGRAQLRLAQAHQHRHERRHPLHGVGLGAAAHDRPVPRAGQGQGRQGDPAGAVVRTTLADDKAPPPGGAFVSERAHAACAVRARYRHAHRSASSTLGGHGQSCRGRRDVFRHDRNPYVSSSAVAARTRKTIKNSRHDPRACGAAGQRAHVPRSCCRSIDRVPRSFARTSRKERCLQPTTASSTSRLVRNTQRTKP